MAPRSTPVGSVGGTSIPTADEIDAARTAQAASGGEAGGEAGASAPEAPSTPPAAAPGPVAVPSGPKRRYRAVAAYGEGDNAVRAGEEFSAAAGDPRIHRTLSYMLADDTPEAVADAFTRANGPTPAEPERATGGVGSSAG